MIAAYNGAAYLPRCIDAISRSRDVDVAVLVVDNASVDEIARIARASGAVLLSLEQNLGYGTAANRGLRQSWAEFVVVMNQDVVVEPSTLKILLDTLESEEAHGRMVLVSPALTDKDGQLCETAHRLPTLRSSIVSLLISERAAGDRNNRNVARTAGEEEWVSAAFVMARRSTWERIGGFDERYFMYVEDVDLFDRARLRGVYCRWEPRARVLHLGGSGPWSGELYASVLRNWMLYWYTRREPSVRLIWAAAWAGAGQRGVTYLIAAGVRRDRRALEYARMFFSAAGLVALRGPSIGSMIPVDEATSPRRPHRWSRLRGKSWRP